MLMVGGCVSDIDFRNTPVSLPDEGNDSVKVTFALNLSVPSGYGYPRADGNAREPVDVVRESLLNGGVDSGYNITRAVLPTWRPRCA